MNVALGDHATQSGNRRMEFGAAREDRCDWWHGTHRVQARDPSSSTWPRSARGLTRYRSERSHSSRLVRSVAGAQVVVDVANSPSFEDAAVMNFFQTADRNLLAAERAAGVRHHVALSVVGADRRPDSGYLVRRWHKRSCSRTPEFLTRSCDLAQFVGRIADEAADENRAATCPAPGGGPPRPPPGICPAVRRR